MAIEYLNMKKLFSKLKEIYLKGLSVEQLIMLAVIIFIFFLSILFYLILNSKNSAFKNNLTKNSSEKNISEPEQKKSDNKNSSVKKLDNHYSNTNVHSLIFGSEEEAGAIENDTQIENTTDYSLPEIPEDISNENFYREEDLSPSPMDGFIEKIKEEHKNDSKYSLIVDYLKPLKEVAKGRRAWSKYMKINAQKFFDEKKIREIEKEINRINGNKEQKIKSSNYGTLDEVFSAIKNDTALYIEKPAIDGFLEHTKDIAEDRGPWSPTVAELGDVNLEEAWVDQLDSKISSLKNQKAKKFRAVSYKNLNQLIAAIKEDTKNYKEFLARDQFLDYVKILFEEKNPSGKNLIDSGVNLLEQYHLDALKTFF